MNSAPSFHDDIDGSIDGRIDSCIDSIDGSIDSMDSIVNLRHI